MPYKNEIIRKAYNDKYYHNTRTLRMKTFGLTLEEYDKMLKEQKGVCAICGKINKSGNRLSVDHNHLTGRVRGLLCTTCNSALGFFDGDGGIKLLLNAIDYVRKYNGRP